MALGLFSRKAEALDSQTILRRADFVPAEKTKLSGDPLARAQQQGRYARILAHRDEWADHPDCRKALDTASRIIDESFALVPEGLVSIAMSIFDQPGAAEQDVETEPFLLARHAVTNAQFQQFVDGGGYEDLEIWPEENWPHLIGFKDLTGESAPRFWQKGRHHRDLADHPVVGISYYEAEAYAKWVGYRLPTEAEWQMAASWRTRSSAHVDRRYPWGDALDLSLCNIWASGYGGTLPVKACAAGAAPNGVVQLIGNTWEWTTSDFEATDRDGRQVVGDTVFKSIRGGAFDTYFAWQAVATFRSGQGYLSRAHNLGFRCAMDLPSS